MSVALIEHRSGTEGGIIQERPIFYPAPGLGEAFRPVRKDFNSILRLFEVFDISAYKINKPILVFL